MKLEYTTLDVFTQEKLCGNQLAIVRVPAALRDQLSEEQKQKIATEFNFPEIVFLHEATADDEVVDYDIFTVKARIAFAGHPTIGAAVYVMKHARASFPSLKSIRTLAGVVPIAFDASTSIASVSVPHNIHIHATRLPHPIPSPNGPATVPLVSIVKGMTFICVPLTSLEALGSGLHLDTFDGWNVGFTGTFYYVDLGLDPEDQSKRLLRTRSIGRAEDYGTGSASSGLCCYLSLLEDKEKGAGPFEFHLVQGVEVGRRCDIFVSVTRTEDGQSIEDVQLRGTAVKVMEGIIDFD
ncbi:phenazine biosynthesis-like protein [Hymenopellis radicata]|nr:phenazine biosynthesis-like protein [Hymenopellis radicata]